MKLLIYYSERITHSSECHNNTQNMILLMGKWEFLQKSIFYNHLLHFYFHK